jgi:hypothetical protein
MAVDRRRQSIAAERWTGLRDLVHSKLQLKTGTAPKELHKKKRQKLSERFGCKTDFWRGGFAHLVKIYLYTEPN